MSKTIKYIFVIIFVFAICEFKIYSIDIKSKENIQNPSEYKTYGGNKKWRFPYWSIEKKNNNAVGINEDLSVGFDNRKKFFSQSNSAGWKILAAPTVLNSYKVVITGPFPVVWNQLKVNSFKIGSMDNRSNWNLKKWTFVLPPATENSITFSFYGEKPYNVPFSNSNSPTLSKQKIWLTKTFPVVHTNLIPSPESSINNIESLTPPEIVQENVKGSWTVDNPSNIFLKLGFYVIFEWSFQNPDGKPPTLIRGKFKVNKYMNAKKFRSKLQQSHIFRKKGIYYIKLKLKFTEMVQDGDKIHAVRRKYSYSKKIVVVESISKYLGNILSTITSPSSINEDIESPFLFKTMFCFSSKLPENSLSTGNRFDGIEPGTVTYKINWGDGQISKESEYPGTKSSLAWSSQKISPRYLNLNGIKHKYQMPGDYIIKLIITYKERHYTGKNYKLSGPITHIQTKEIQIHDKTPPVFVKGAFENLHGTSGDPLEVKIQVSDNDPYKPISKAILHYSIYPEGWHSIDSPIVWKKVDARIEKIDSQTWNVSGKISLPLDFATKKFSEVSRKSMKTLKYYFEIVDNAGNINNGDSNICDNHDFMKNYGENGTDFGEISVKDNDPPDIWIFFDNKQFNRKFTFEVSGGERDFYQSDTMHGKIKKYCSDSISSMTHNVSLYEKPLPGILPDKLTPFEFKSYSINIQENMDIKLQWKVYDSIDGNVFLMSNGILVEKCNFIFKGAETKKIDFYSFDNKNPDGSVNGRKLLIDFNVQKSNVSK